MAKKSKWHKYNPHCNKIVIVYCALIGYKTDLPRTASCQLLVTSRILATSNLQPAIK